MRKLTASILLAIGLMGTACAETTPAVTPTTPVANQGSTAAPANTPSTTEVTATQATTTPVATPESVVTNTVVTENVEIATEAHGGGFDQDLSVWGMYQNADVVVKTVMIGLLLASVITWALFLSKGTEILTARRRLKD
ncbi:tonB-system energizer ExbB, partial [Providencia rettgeri]